MSQVVYNGIKKCPKTIFETFLPVCIYVKWYIMPRFCAICGCDPCDSPPNMTSRCYACCDSVLPDEDLELLAGIADFNLTVR